MNRPGELRSFPAMFRRDDTILLSRKRIASLHRLFPGLRAYLKKLFFSNVLPGPTCAPTEFTLALNSWS